MLRVVVTVGDVMFEVFDACIVQRISTRRKAHSTQGKASPATQSVYAALNVHDEWVKVSA